MFTNNKTLSVPFEVTEKWKSDETLVCNNECKFEVQYLGLSHVSDPTDLATCCSILKELIGKRKTIKGLLKINTYSLVLFEKQTNDIKFDQTLKDLILCASHPGIPYTFFYTTRDTLSNDFLLCGFISMKEVSDRIIKAILFALEIYSENQAESANNLSTFQKLEDDKSFIKQNSLMERYQDPQSSILISHPKIGTSKTISDLKSIPRPKSYKTVKKATSQFFPNLNPNDLFKQNEPENLESRHSEKSNSSHEELFDILIPNTLSNDDCLAFNNNMHSVFEDKPLNETNFFSLSSNFETKSSQPSKYDILKNMNTPFLSSGWSEEISGIHKTKQSQISVASTAFDEFLNSFIENNLNNSKNIFKK